MDILIIRVICLFMAWHAAKNNCSHRRLFLAACQASDMGQIWIKFPLPTIIRVSLPAIVGFLCLGF